MADEGFFSISSGTVSGSPAAYITVLRNAAKTLKNDFEGKNLYVHALYATEAYHGDLPTSDRTVSMSVDYWLTSEEDVAEHHKNQKTWEEQGMLEAPTLPPVIHKKPETESAIGLLEQRIDQSKYPADVATLLEEVATTIETLGDVEIIDLVYQDYSDKDSRQIPFVRFYYMSKASSAELFKYS